jgi:hypothetical protein
MRGARIQQCQVRGFYAARAAAARLFRSPMRSDSPTTARASFLRRVLPLLQPLLRSCNACTLYCSTYFLHCSTYFLHCSTCFLHCSTCFLHCSACCVPTGAAIKQRHPATTPQPVTVTQQCPAKAPSATLTCLSSNFFAVPAPFHPASTPALPLRLPAPLCKFRACLFGARKRCALAPAASSSVLRAGCERQRCVT